ncbi:Solute carrier 13 [Sparganum proliferum]
MIITSAHNLNGSKVEDVSHFGGMGCYLRLWVQPSHGQLMLVHARLQPSAGFLNVVAHSAAALKERCLSRRGKLASARFGRRWHLRPVYRRVLTSRLKTEMSLFRIHRCLTIVSFYFRYAFIIAYPIILSPILIRNSGTESKAAYILLLMSGFWITGFIPLYVTALFPLILAPLMGLVPSAVIAKEYASSSTFLFLGGMILAIAAENTNLHRRIAVAFMRCMGQDPRLLILSVMLPTWFLSMWMSNTATTVMMITIVEALLIKLDDATGASSEVPGLKEEMGEKRKSRNRLRRFATGISLSVCYAAGCGGIATLIGSPPNIIFYGLAVSRFGSEIPLNFGSWMAYGLPMSLLCMISTWITICLLFLGPKAFFKCGCGKKKEAPKQHSVDFTEEPTPAKSTEKLQELEDSSDQEDDEEIPLDIVAIVKKISEEERRVLGPMKFGEIACMILFILLIGLWITREPGVPGWSRFMPVGNDSRGRTVMYVDDTQPTILFTILAFIIPATNPFLLHKNETETDKQARKRINSNIITWEVANSRTCWGVLILLGGGFALSKIVSVGGLSRVITDALQSVQFVPPFGLVCIITVLGAGITEIVSNSATVTILVPIMFDLAKSINVHPFLLSLPLTVATSLAFMLPAATAPNAIVYSKGRVKLVDMAKTGIILNFPVSNGQTSSVGIMPQLNPIGW